MNWGRTREEREAWALWMCGAAFGFLDGGYLSGGDPNARVSLFILAGIAYLTALALYLWGKREQEE